MLTENLNTVQYYLDMYSDFINVNQLIGSEIEIHFEDYECLSCSENKEIFRQGFCKSCFFETPLAGDWIMRPELSKAHLNIQDRDLEYEKKMQLQDHIVYLANSGNVKVGVTRKSQVPTRWIDQGAHEALAILEVPNRYLAGIAEVALKEHISDKTNWRVMLKNEVQNIDLEQVIDGLKQYIPNEVKDYFLDNHQVQKFRFPIKEYPKKVKSLNLREKELFKSKLIGIKGQYLIFEDGTVFNIRANEGLVVRINL